MGFNLIRWLDNVTEDVWSLLFQSPEMAFARSKAMKIAREYHLDEDDEAFRELWFLTTKATLYEHAVHEEAKAEVARCLDLLKFVVDVAPAEPTRFGAPISFVPDDAFQTAQIAPIAGRYVVFSDHHMLFDGARQNFFKHGYKAQKKERPPNNNYDLYLEILSEYYGPEDYCLVENGDVEELLIFEPEIAELRNANAWTWDEIDQYREAKKRLQLPAIARDNRSYYETLQTHFIAKRKFFRLTGNHDRDMRDDSFAGMIRAVTGTDLPVASDILLLRGSQHVDCVICHGHQFDTSCTPKFAEKLGETFTLAGAWAYQGPDRVWREGADPIEAWRSGSKPFRNELVSDEPDDYVTVLEQLVQAFDPVTGDLIADGVQYLADALGAAIGTLDTERGWENVYGKNIAWEYFDNANSPKRAIAEEVETGKRWFKYRHMNEFRIVNGLESAFDGTPPLLILGHSHEPRFHPGYNAPGLPRRQIDWYLNGASAGRFQNLIWGIELIDGEPFLISWHREDRGAVGKVPVRTIWEDGYTGSVYVLKPVSAATIPELRSAAPEPVAEDASVFRIAADHVL